MVKCRLGLWWWSPSKRTCASRANTHSETAALVFPLKASQEPTETRAPHPVPFLVSAQKKAETVSRMGSMALPLIPPFSLLPNCSLWTSHQLWRVGKGLKVLYDLVTHWLLTWSSAKGHYLQIPSNCFHTAPKRAILHGQCSHPYLAQWLLGVALETLLLLFQTWVMKSHPVLKRNNQQSLICSLFHEDMSI